jgi:para-nitrobenzyl esterase
VKRFRAPEPVAPWAGIFDATAFGPAAIQTPQNLSPLGRLALYDVTTSGERQSEDCLTLNVWDMPNGSAGKPVMVWLHGGAFNSSSAANPACDGASLARTGEAVIVSLNHRVGLFGFLNTELVGSDYAGSANAGMLDMIAALRWVRDNIAAFGGDPGNVTVFGGAAGGEKLSVLLAMPAAAGLIHRAIIQSGPRRQVHSREDSARLTDAVLAELGLDKSRATALVDMPAESLLAVEAAAVRRSAVPRGIAPTVDGAALPAQPFETRAPHSLPDIPILIGTNSDEMTFGAFLDPGFFELSAEKMRERVVTMVGDEASDVLAHYTGLHPAAAPYRLLSYIRTDRERREPSIREAEMILGRNRSPVYMYRLDWGSPLNDGAVGAVHMLEQPLVFGNVPLQPNLCGDDPDALAVSQVMSEAWLSFARSGDPRTGRLADWSPYTIENRATMVFDVDSRVEHDPGKAERLLWQRLNN